MTTPNRRILNATPVTSDDGIDMKSKNELRIYNALRSLGIKPLYESEKFVYWKGPRPSILFYDRGTDRHLRKNMKKMVDMSYTPDFTFMYKGVKVIIEVKGWENDQFSIRKKLFRAYLESLKEPVVYAEIFTKKQLLEFMKELEEQIVNIKKQKTMIGTCKRLVPEAEYIQYDGTNFSEVVQLLGCRSNYSPTVEAYIERCKTDNVKPEVFHSSVGSIQLEVGMFIILEENIVYVCNNEDRFNKHFIKSV